MTATETLLKINRRADFPAIPEGWSYLDTAATAQKPQPVVDAIAQGYARDYATVHRGVYTRSADMTVAYERARARVAAFIGADSPDEIVFVRGETEAINLVAQSWGVTHLKPGHPIKLSVLQHHTNILPGQFITARPGNPDNVTPRPADPN